MKKINLNSEEIEIIRKNAKKAEVGGFSNVREHNDRYENLSIDQFTAQLGEAALSKFLTGNIDLYLKTREKANVNKYKGDGGTDLLGMRVDAKTSRMRRGMNFTYNLWVRDREYHEDVNYYLFLIPVEKDDTVYLAGEILGKELPESIEGRRGVPMNRLKESKSPLESSQLGFNIDP